MMKTFYARHIIPTVDLIAHRMEKGMQGIPDEVYFVCAKQLAMEILRSKVVEFQVFRNVERDTVELRARIDV